MKKQFLQLLVLSALFIFFLLYWQTTPGGKEGGTGRGREEETRITAEAEAEGPVVAFLPLYKAPTFSDAPNFDEYVLNYIRTHHLVQYDSNLETDYSGAIDNWDKHPMSSFIVKHLNSKRNGFFVECGASDGVFISNTLQLERSLGWTGLLVEANPDSFTKLKAVNRNAWRSNTCLSPQPYPIRLDMFRHKDLNPLTYLKATPNETARGVEWNTTFPVQCFPLSMLMAAIGRTEIDYLSLDVEGVELEILKTIPFDKLRIKLISAEVNFPGKDNKKEIKAFLESLGYKKIKEFAPPEVPYVPWFLVDDLYELQEDH